MRKSAPLPTRRASSLPNRRTPRLPKSAPLPNRRTSPQLPKMELQSIPRKSSPPPPNLSTIHEDIRLKILHSVFENDILNNEIIKMFSIFTINKGFNSLSFVRPYLMKNVTIINLQSLTITKEIVDILNLTINDQITTIVLRRIIFENATTLNKFLEFFKKNTMVKFLILDDINIDSKGSEKLFKLLQNFERLIWLEIRNNKLSEYLNLKYILVYTKSLQYLTFTDNTVTSNYFDFMFTQDVNYNFVDNNIRYNMYISEVDGDWGMVIKNNATGKVFNNFEVNILNNRIIGSKKIIDYKNNFADYNKFIQ